MGFYRIHGLGPCLDGLVVETKTVVLDTAVSYDIVRIFNLDAVVGDRQVSYPVYTGLSIEGRCLESVDDPTKREFDHRNPHGKLLYEQHFKKDDLHVDLAQFEKRLQVTVREEVNGRSRTLFSDYFDQDELKELEAAAVSITLLIENALSSDDTEDLVFQLRQSKEDVK